METDLAGSPSVARQPQREEAEAALCELQEQFEAYKKEKRENDAILNKQLDEMREQASALRIDNAKLASKVQSVYDSNFQCCHFILHVGTLCNI